MIRHMMRMGGERMRKKMLPPKMEGKRPRGSPRTRCIYIGYRNERGKLGRNTRKQEVGE